MSFLYSFFAQISKFQIRLLTFRDIHIVKNHCCEYREIATKHSITITKRSYFTHFQWAFFTHFLPLCWQQITHQWLNFVKYEIYHWIANFIGFLVTRVHEGRAWSTSDMASYMKMGCRWTQSKTANSNFM